MTKNLMQLYVRELRQLQEELRLYRKEENIWRTDQQISNSAGNLTLHLVGNLNFFIGSVLGQTGYIRDRPAEFSMKNVSRQELIAQLSDTIIVVQRVFGTLTPAELNAIYPEKTPFDQVSTEFFLLHLGMHLSYHLGQVNYHRRLLDNA